MESFDDLEQYSRRNCLFLHIVKETKNQNIDQVTIKTLSEEMNIDINHDDLYRTHRIGKADRNDGKPTPIIIKFARYAVRNNVYRIKKKLKGKNFVITESLAITRVKALRVAQ